MALRRFAVAVLPLAALPAHALAQPADLPIAAATTATYPPGVKVARSDAGAVYVDGKGRTLYGLDMRVLLREGPDPSSYCASHCGGEWEPLLAPAGAKVNIAYPVRRREDDQAGDPEFHSNPQKAPDWTVIDGPAGPQWVYKGWHMVYVRKGDRPGSTAFDGAEDFRWNTLKFVPPVPEVKAPNGVKPAYVEGAYVLVDGEGRVLFTGKCKSGCAAWKPLAGGLANLGQGDWSIARGGDTPQWAFKGRPVYASGLDDPKTVPAGGKVLRP